MALKQQRPKRYIKEDSTHRLTVKFLNGETGDQLFEIKDRNAANVGEIFADFYVDQLIKQVIKEKDLPSSVVLLVTGDYKLA